jgi:hypothetical protein
MSISLTNAVWKHSKQKSGALIVLLAIADYANDEGNAWPSVSTLARKVRMSKRNVQRWLSTLQRDGELRVLRNQGRCSVNIYKICLPPGKAEKGDARATNDTGDAKPVTSISSTNEADVTQSVNETSKERTPIVPKGDDTDFWIKVSFDCFRQTCRPLPRQILRKLARALPALDRKNAGSLLEFYRFEELDSKKVPFNSRKHSPERLLLHLPEQLALAVQTCPPPPPAKKEPPQWREFFWWKYDPTVGLPKSFWELDRDLREEYERDFQTFEKTCGDAADKNN